MTDSALGVVRVAEATDEAEVGGAMHVISASQELR